jgi:thiamine-phosphate pyrophosphorylase
MSSAFLNAMGGTRLYPVTDRPLSLLSHAEQVAQLSEGGATLIQLREKVLSTLDFYHQAEAALQVARERGVKIIINDRVDIVLALKADGVHLGQDDLPPAAARSILGPDVIIGFSTHTPEQALLAAKMPVDYVAIGPIFPTSTKQTSNPTVGIDGLRQVRQAIGTVPIVAIGGITLENSEAVLSAGADAVSVIRDIWIPAGQAPILTRRFVRGS